MNGFKQNPIGVGPGARLLMTLAALVGLAGSVLLLPALTGSAQTHLSGYVAGRDAWRALPASHYLATVRDCRYKATILSQQRATLQSRHVRVSGECTALL